MGFASFLAERGAAVWADLGVERAVWWLVDFEAVRAVEDDDLEFGGGGEAGRHVGGRMLIGSVLDVGSRRSYAARSKKCRKVVLYIYFNIFP